MSDEARYPEPPEWSEIRDDLKTPIPKRLLKTKKQGGTTLTFCPWYRVQKILDHYSGGWWEYSIIDKEWTDEYFVCTVEICILTKQGGIRRQGTGIESAATDTWGDAQSNAESMAFRRAAARFGIGIDLYEGGA